MFDLRINALVKPVLDPVAASLIQIGLRANHLTAIAFIVGLSASAFITFGYFLSALLLFLISRLCDGLDGAMARLTTPTDRGGFLDITLDMLVYASVPLAFALHEPATNALATVVLLFGFIGTSASFLAYASIAAKRQSPIKSIHYLGGLTEGFETILCLSLMCVLPEHFAEIAYTFAGMCAITTTMRLWAGWCDFS